MQKIFTILAIVFTTGLFSCAKENMDSANCTQNDPPIWCATVRCTPDGKPVCGCNNITYGSVCEAECSGISSYTMGACK